MAEEQDVKFKFMEVEEENQSEENPPAFQQNIQVLPNIPPDWLHQFPSFDYGSGPSNISNVASNDRQNAPTTFVHHRSSGELDCGSGPSNMRPVCTPDYQNLPIAHNQLRNSGELSNYSSDSSDEYIGQLMNPYIHNLVPNKNGFKIEPPPDFFRVSRSSSTSSFSLFYIIIPEYLSQSFFLNISIVPDLELSSNLTSCPKHGNGIWFSCNKNPVYIYEAYSVQLDNTRIEKNICCEFYCTNQCSSMYSKTKLRFTVVNQHNEIFYCREVPFKVSERPKRDERISPRPRPVTNNELLDNEIYYQYLYNELTIHDKIFKQVPQLKNYGSSFFDVFPTDPKHIGSDIISEKMLNPISLKIIMMLPYENLRLKMIVVDPMFLENIVINRSDGFGPFVLSCTNEQTEYYNNITDVYADKRLACITQLREEIVIKFMCNHTTFLEKNRKFVGLVIILEDQHRMYAQRFLKFRIVEKPERPLKHLKT